MGVYLCMGNEVQAVGGEAWIVLFTGWSLGVLLGAAPGLPHAAVGDLQFGPGGYDPNRMHVRQLRRLPGIGATRAQAIVTSRYQALETGVCLDWRTAPGIGPATERAVGAWLSERNGSELASRGGLAVR